MNRSVEILIHNDISEIAVVRDALEQLGNEFSVPMRAITQLQVALDEVVSNVVKYSWPDDEKHKLLVRITVDAAGVVLDIYDDGQPFDPRDAPEPVAPPAGKRPRPGGIGIHMIKQLVDDLAYERIDGRNHTSLKKKCAIGAVYTEDKQ